MTKTIEHIQREIKLFRAWDHDNNKMIYWTLNDLLVRFGDPKYQYNVEDRPSPMFNWMQYTGYLDLNEKPIFVGDILQTKEYFNESLQANYKKIGVVRYDDGFSDYDVGYFVDGKEFKDGKEWRTFKSDLKKARYGIDGNYNMKPITDCGYVIGNIYEHPELLRERE